MFEDDAGALLSNEERTVPYRLKATKLARRKRTLFFLRETTQKEQKKNALRPQNL